MNKFIIGILAIFEFLFYTFFMVLIGNIGLENEILKLVIHFGSLLVISTILYLLIKIILKKLNMNSKKSIYLIVIWNLVLGILFPGILSIIIPSEKIFLVSMVIIVSTIYYGIFINVFLSLLNFILTKDKN